MSKTKKLKELRKYKKSLEEVLLYVMKARNHIKDNYDELSIESDNKNLMDKILNQTLSVDLVNDLYKESVDTKKKIRELQ